MEGRGGRTWSEGLLASGAAALAGGASGAGPPLLSRPAPSGKVLGTVCPSTVLIACPQCLSELSVSLGIPKLSPSFPPQLQLLSAGSHSVTNDRWRRELGIKTGCVMA